MALRGGQVQMSGYVPDYSGAAEAANAPIKAMSGIVGEAVDMFKERKKIESSVKASRTGIESAIKLGESLGIDVKSSLQPILQKMDNPNTPLTESALLGDMAAKQITNVLNLGIGEQDRLMKMQSAQADAAYKAEQLGLAERRTVASEYKARQAGAPKYELKTAEIVDPQTGETFEQNLPFNPRTGRYFDQSAGKEILNIQEWSQGKPSYVEDTEMPTPTSQLGGSASELIANAAKMNIGKLSTAKTPGTQGGNMGCADAICRTFKQATGEELVPGGTLSTREMATNLSNDPRFVKVSLNEAQKGDIVLTPRRGNKAGHTGIVLDDGVIASNSSKGFAGKSPGTFVQNYTIDSWKNKVAPRNPKETVAYRYVGSQGISNALSMGGDMSQQAMGTPEQQTMIANMIEGNQGLATAQNIPQGAMATDPSVIPTQPQQVAQQTPAMSETARAMMQRGFRPKAQSKFRPFTADEIQQYGSQGQVNTETGEVRPIRPPSGMVIEQTPGGGFRVVQGVGVNGRQEQVQKAQQEQKISRSIMGTQEIGRAIEVLDSGVMKGSGPLASFYRAGASKFVKGTPEYKLANEFIAPIKSMLAFDELNKMRAASPTGGALGNVAKFETDMLQQTAGQLDIDKADPKTIRENLMRLSEKYLDAVHGTIQDREKLLRDNKISKETFLEILSLYPAFTMSSTGESVPRQFPETDQNKTETEAERILREIGE